MIVDIQEIIEKYLNNTLIKSSNYIKVEVVLEKLFSSEYHFPKMTPKFYCDLEKKNDKNRFLSNIATHNLKTIYNRIITIHTELQNVPCLLKIVENSDKLILVEEINYNGGKIKKIVLSLDRLESNYFEQAHILVENLIDSDLYLHLSKIYLNKKNLDIFELKLYPINGGGNQIYYQYKTSFKIEKKIGICITDSDKSYPNSKYGNTTAKLLEEKDENTFSQIFILDNQRELENFIPVEFLKDIYVSSDKKKFDNFLGKVDKKFYDFIDYKKGISILDFKDSDFFNFWENIISQQEINCSFSLKLNSIQEREYNFNNIYEIKKFLETADKDTLKQLKNIFICEGYGSEISKQFYKTLVEKKDKLENQINSIKKNTSLSEKELVEKVQKIQAKIDDFQKLKDKIFENNNLINLLDSILLWGVNVRNISKHIL